MVTSAEDAGRPRRRSWWPCLALAPGLALCLCLPVGRPTALVRAHQVWLRHFSDHAAILGASRDLMRVVKPGEDLHFSTNDHALPDALRGRGRVTVRADEVWQECGGGFYHYGFRAFGPGSAEERSLREYDGHCYWEKLRDGLWIYHD